MIFIKIDTIQNHTEGCFIYATPQYFNIYFTELSILFP